MVKDITIPDIGEKIEEGQVVGILVSVGDSVELEQGIIEFETDKAVVEIPSPESGRITEILVSNGDTVKVGKPIAKIETNATGDGKEESKEVDEKPEKEKKASAAKDDDEREEKKKADEDKAKAQEEDDARKEPDKAKEPERKSSAPDVRKKESEKKQERPYESVPASPSVRRLARELGVDIRDVAAGGLGGRVTADDVKRHVKFVGEGRSAHAPGVVATQMPDFTRWGEVEVVQASQVRGVIAESTTTSWNTIPHVTQYDEADVTGLNTFLKSKAKLAEKAGAKLTVSAVLLKVLSAALRRFPMFNTSYDMANRVIHKKKYYHIGVAVDTPRGLLVPVLRDVDKKSVIAIAKEMTDLAQRARDKKISAEEMEGGTFTLSNQGAIGGINFTPIVYWPQVAILGVSRAAVRPVYMDGEFEAREMLPLSLSYDHRVVDGADAVRFLRWVADALENPLNMHLEG